MKVIQPVLIVLMVGIAILYFAKMRSRFLDRVIVLFFAVAGAILVSAPGIATALAQLVGVGRGVDVVIYLSLVSIGFLILLLISKIRDLENKVTILTREVALQG